MTDQHRDWLMEQPAAGLILAAYAERELHLPKRPTRTAAAVPAEPAAPSVEADAVSESESPTDDAENADAWVPRVASIEGLDAAQLSQLHGGLIARGFLKYELFGRQTGMRYRLTPDGRRAAESAETAVATETAA